MKLIKYCIIFKDLGASELKFQWKKQIRLQILNYDYFVTKNRYQSIKDKSMPRHATFGIKAGFMQLICTRVYIYLQVLDKIMKTPNILAS